MHADYNRSKFGFCFRIVVVYARVARSSSASATPVDPCTIPSEPPRLNPLITMWTVLWHPQKIVRLFFLTFPSTPSTAQTQRQPLTQKSEFHTHTTPKDALLARVRDKTSRRPWSRSKRPSSQNTRRVCRVRTQRIPIHSEPTEKRRWRLLGRLSSRPSR